MMRNDQSRLLFCLAIRSNPRNAYKYSDGRMLTWRVYRDKRCRRSIYASGINATSLAAPPFQTDDIDDSRGSPVISMKPVHYL